MGLSLAAFAVPVNGRASILNWRSFGIACAFVALANLPDWPLPNWGHDRHDISHSIFVNVGLIGLGMLFFRLFNFSSVLVGFVVGAMLIVGYGCLIFTKDIDAGG